MKEDTGKLLKEAQTMEERSRMLRVTAEWISGEIDKTMKETTDNKLGTMDWEEGEAKYKKLMELEGRLIGNVKDLFKLDTEYRSIAERVNEAYGRKVLDLLPPLNIADFLSPE